MLASLTTICSGSLKSLHLHSNMRNSSGYQQCGYRIILLLALWRCSLQPNVPSSPWSIQDGWQGLGYWNPIQRHRVPWPLWWTISTFACRRVLYEDAAPQLPNFALSMRWVLWKSSRCSSKKMGNWCSNKQMGVWQDRDYWFERDVYRIGSILAQGNWFVIKLNARLGGIEQELFHYQVCTNMVIRWTSWNTGRGYETAESEGGTQAKIKHRWN